MKECKKVSRCWRLLKWQIMGYSSWRWRFYRAQWSLQGAWFILALPIYAIYNRRHIQIYSKSTSGSVQNKITCPIFPAWYSARILVGYASRRCDLNEMAPSNLSTRIKTSKTHILGPLVRYLLSDRHIPDLAYRITAKLFGLPYYFLLLSSFNLITKPCVLYIIFLSPWTASIICFVFLVGFTVLSASLFAPETGELWLDMNFQSSHLGMSIYSLPRVVILCTFRSSHFKPTSLCHD